MVRSYPFADHCHCLLTAPNLQKLTVVRHAFNFYLIIKNHKKNNNLMQIL